MEFTINGSGFDLIPINAIGLPATNNDEPLQFLNTTDTHLVAQIVSHSDASISFAASGASSHNALYLGCIVSADRSVVYWINESRPLP